MGDLPADIFRRTEGIPLVDKYAAYQILADNWPSIMGDVEIIQTEGFGACNVVEPKMKMVKDKQILMAADFAGYPLKEAIKEYLEKKGWTVTDIGVKADSDPNDTELMFHRIGLRVGAMITEKEFERALIFCGTGMGIHIAASKCPGVHAGVVESVPAAFRAITGNGVNVLAMGAFYVTPELGKQCADAFLYNDFGSGWEWWPDFDKFHQIAIDELNAFNYEEYKANGFKVKHLGDCHCELYDRPEGFSSVPLMCKR